MRDPIPETKRLVLDLTDVTYMDRSGLGALVGACISARRAQCELKLVHLGPRVKELFRISKMAKIFEGHVDMLGVTPEFSSHKVSSDFLLGITEFCAYQPVAWQPSAERRATPKHADPDVPHPAAGQGGSAREFAVNQIIRFHKLQPQHPTLGRKP